MSTTSIPFAVRGAVILVPFPFTDLTTTKRRPAVILSTTAQIAGTADVVIAQVTGNVQRGAIGDYLILDWAQAGLRMASVVRPKLATIHTSLILRHLGKVTDRDLAGIEASVRIALGL